MTDNRLADDEQARKDALMLAAEHDDLLDGTTLDAFALVDTATNRHTLPTTEIAARAMRPPRTCDGLAQALRDTFRRR